MTNKPKSVNKQPQSTVDSKVMTKNPTSELQAEVQAERLAARHHEPLHRANQEGMAFDQLDQLTSLR